MKNIKFKAKALNSGEWVVGDLLHRVTDTCIAVKDMDDIVYYPVKPATVCQFTGLTDCEGKEVWEGDMLSNVTDNSPDGTVVFKYGAFCLLAKNGRDFCVALTYLLSENDSLKRFKVVGNKFDKEK